MSQQQPIPQQQGTPVQQAGQAGQFELGQTGQVGQQMGLRLQDVQTPQERAVLENISWAVEVTEWCADQCIQLADPSMTECIRLCRDTSEIGRTALGLLPRNSRYAQTILEAFAQVARNCAQECSYHKHAHCQECAQVLGQALDSIQPFVGAGGQIAQTGSQMGQMGGQLTQTGGQMGQMSQTGGQMGQTGGQMGQMGGQPIGQR